MTVHPTKTINNLTTKTSKLPSRHTLRILETKTLVNLDHFKDLLATIRTQI